ncbi:MAG: YchJ family protein [Magnetospirillum sp.]|nr:YchJ family protein [Magnetospirillum sp.]
MTLCPCGSGRGYDECCAPLLAGAAAATPEALMRSRYTAFVRHDIGYLERTLAPESAGDFDRAETETWAKEAQWQRLEVRGAALAEENGSRGTVEFVAHYRFRGKTFAHHELGVFRKEDGRWLYVDGEINPKTAPRAAAKVGRNDPCPCGSGKKYKKCCGA